MLDTEDTARRLLADAVSDAPAGIDLMAGVRKRQAARRTRTRASLAAAATAVIAAGTTVGLTVSQAPSALAAVTAAVARTSAQSYHLTMTYSISGSFAVPKSTVFGAFNPALRTGEEETAIVAAPGGVPGARIHNTVEWRFVGGKIYVSIPESVRTVHSKRWLEFPPGFSKVLQDGPNGQLGVLMPFSPQFRTVIVNPNDLLAALRSVGQVRELGRVAGPGWTGTRYGFTAKLPANRGSRTAILRLRGTVDVDQHGRVRNIRSTVPVTTATASLTWTISLAFSHYGVPVSVTAPPASDTGTWPPPVDYFRRS